MKNFVIAAVALLLLAGGVFALMRNDSEPADTSGNGSETEQILVPDEQQSDSPEAVETNTVSIENFAYTPQAITIKKGTKVTWTNKDSAVHTVTSDEGSVMDSGNMSQGETYSVTFNEAGTFTYHCVPHPNMTGTVIVTE